VPAEVAVTEESVTTPINEVAGLVQVPLVSGFAVQLDQCSLDLGMTTDAIDLAWLDAHSGDEAVCHPAGNLEQAGLSSGSVQGDCSLDQVSGAVQLVSPLELDEPFAREMHLEVGVEITIWLLRRAEQLLRRNQLVRQSLFDGLV
jgi:hypothetical protein